MKAEELRRRRLADGTIETHGIGTLDRAKLDDLAGDSPAIELKPPCHRQAGVYIAYVPKLGQLRAACRVCLTVFAGFALSNGEVS